MGRKRSFRASAEAARELIKRNDVFHDPVAIERGGDGLEYVPEKVRPPSEEPESTNDFVSSSQDDLDDDDFPDLDTPLRTDDAGNQEGE